MKIAVFSSTADPKDGYGNITHELCLQLKKSNIDFVLFLPKNHRENNPLPNDIEIRYVLPEYVFSSKTPKIISYFNALDLKGFSLVHSLFAFPYSFLAALSARKNNIPFIMGAQGTYGVRPLTFFPERHLLKWSYNQAKKIIVPSQFTKEKILEYAKSDYPISIIHNGVNFSKFQNIAINHELQNKYEEHKVLLTVGGLMPRKGQDLIIKALPKIVKRYPEVKYLLVGGGRMEGEWKNLAKEYQVEDYVEFTGRVEGNSVPQYFSICDIYVHTPKVIDLSFEGFGIVYLEASACGKPIVATDAGGIKDAVLDGQTGLIAQDSNIEQITEHILYLLENPDIVEQYGEQGRIYAKEHDWPQITAHFISVYKEYSL